MYSKFITVYYLSKPFYGKKMSLQKAQNEKFTISFQIYCNKSKIYILENIYLSLHAIITLLKATNTPLLGLLNQEEINLFS